MTFGKLKIIAISNFPNDSIAILSKPVYISISLFEKFNFVVSALLIFLLALLMQKKNLRHLLLLFIPYIAFRIMIYIINLIFFNADNALMELLNMFLPAGVDGIFASLMFLPIILRTKSRFWKLLQTIVIMYIGGILSILITETTSLFNFSKPPMGLMQFINALGICVVFCLAAYNSRRRFTFFRLSFRILLHGVYILFIILILFTIIVTFLMRQGATPIWLILYQIFIFSLVWDAFIYAWLLPFLILIFTSRYYKELISGIFVSAEAVKSLDGDNNTATAECAVVSDSESIGSITSNDNNPEEQEKSKKND